LFRRLLPSLFKRPDTGYHYHVFIGYDLGDRLWSNTSTLARIHYWFLTHVTYVLRVKFRIRVELHIHELSVGTLNGPIGPVVAFNQLLLIAYHFNDTGSGTKIQYFLPLNDDNHFTTGWANIMVMALWSIGNPNVTRDYHFNSRPPHLNTPNLTPPIGVVGPLSFHGLGGADTTLLWQMTHRSHMDIFAPYYYPPRLPLWSLDRWICSVYGYERVRLVAEVRLYHNSHAHGTRHHTPIERSVALADQRIAATISTGVQRVWHYINIHARERFSGQALASASASGKFRTAQPLTAFDSGRRLIVFPPPALHRIS